MGNKAKNVRFSRNGYCVSRLFNLELDTLFVPATGM